MQVWPSREKSYKSAKGNNVGLSSRAFHFASTKIYKYTPRIVIQSGSIQMDSWTPRAAKRWFPSAVKSAQSCPVLVNKEGDSKTGPIRSSVNAGQQQSSRRIKTVDAKH